MHLRQKMIAAAVAALAMGLSPCLNAGNRSAGPVPAASLRAPAPATQRPPQGPEDLMASCTPFSYPWTDTPVNPDVPDDDDTLRGGGAAGGGRAGRLAPMAMPGGSDAAAFVIGRSPDEVHRNFTMVVAGNFSGPAANTVLMRLSDHELAEIDRLTRLGSPADRAQLLKRLATRLDARGLLRVAEAFGRAPVEAAVAAYAQPAVRAGFRQLAGGSLMNNGGDSYPSPSPPRPNIDMTLREIYLEYRTAPIGSLGPAASLAETAMYAGRYISPAATTGVAIGTGIHLLIEEFAPGIDDAIGGTIGAMIDNFWDAGTEFQEGHFESAFDSLFGFPLTWSSDPYGDWNISAPMMFYYQSASTCGW